MIRLLMAAVVAVVLAQSAQAGPLQRIAEGIQERREARQAARANRVGIVERFADRLSDRMGPRIGDRIGDRLGERFEKLLPRAGALFKGRSEAVLPDAPVFASATQCDCGPACNCPTGACDTGNCQPRRVVFRK